MIPQLGSAVPHWPARVLALALLAVRAAKNEPLADEAERARSQLLKRLERYAELGIGRLMLWREEPRS